MDPLSERLHWERDGTGFVAYPEGEDKPTICARLLHVTGGSWQWSWSVSIGECHRNGMAEIVQAASDEANDAWPMVIADAAAASEQATRRAAMFSALDKIEAGSILGPENFGIEAATGDELLWLIAECRRRWEKTREPDSAPGKIPPLHPGIEKVMSAASNELHHRRLAGMRST